MCIRDRHEGGVVAHLVDDEGLHFVDPEGGHQPVDHDRQTLAILTGPAGAEVVDHRGAHGVAALLEAPQVPTQVEAVEQGDGDADNRQPPQRDHADDGRDHEHRDEDGLGHPLATREVSHLSLIHI